jgi:hypothetical protein
MLLHTQQTRSYVLPDLWVGRQVLASGSLLRSGQTEVSEPKIGEHAQ